MLIVSSEMAVKKYCPREEEEYITMCKGK